MKDIMSVATGIFVAIMIIPVATGILVAIMIILSNTCTAQVNRNNMFAAHEKYLLLKSKGISVTMDSNGDLWLWNEQMQTSLKLDPRRNTQVVNKF